MRKSRKHVIPEILLPAPLECPLGALVTIKGLVDASMSGKV